MKAKRLVFLALCMVMALTSSILPTALTIKASESSDSYLKYDYSNPDSSFNVTATAADVLEQLGYDVSDAERAYLDAYCEFEVNYDLVLNDKITRSTSVKDSVTTVTVKAESHVYTAKNGQSVSWIPLQAEIRDASNAVVSVSDMTPDGSSYIADFIGIEEDPNYTYAVSYGVSFELDAEDVNYILNFAYSTKDAMAYYEANTQSVLTYYAYLAEQQRWEQNKAEYDAYPGKLAEYNAKLTAYNNYETELATYLDIKNKLDNYNSELAKYNNYLKELEAAMAHMEALNTGLYNKMTYLERGLYASLQSDLVDEVVARKDELVAVRPKLEGPINNAKTASLAIQQIFEPQDEGATIFEELKTDKEKYAFYVNNYDAICDNLLLLAESLYYIYTTAGIRDLMHTAPQVLDRPDYTEKLSIFIAQLFCLCDALIDTEEPIKYADAKGNKYTTSEMTFSYWKSAQATDAGAEKKNVKIADLFEGKVYVEDKNNSKPTAPPTEVTKPAEPAVKELPPMPEAVEHPGAKPEEVKNPGSAPAVVNKPAGLPEFNWEKFIHDPDYSTVLSNLYNEIKNNTEARAEVTSSVPLTLTMTVERPFASVSVDVIFNDADGNEIYRTTVEKGSAATFGGQIPTKESDVSATYSFSGWVTSEGKEYSLHSVNENITLYPNFTTVYREYTVSGGYLTVDATDANVSEISIDRFSVLMNTTSATRLKIDAKDATVIIKSDVISKLRTANVSYVDVDLVAQSAYKYTYTVNAYDASGAKVDVDAVVEMHLPCMKSNLTVNCADTDGTAVDAHSNAGLNYFNATLGKSYSIVAGYRITCTYGNTLDIPKFAVPGETVEFTVNLIEGMKADVNYVLNGVKYPVTGNSFVMPEGDISIDATFSDIIYTVRFESDGKVIFEKYYKYGDIIEKPNTPTKINDDKYSYRFSHWSPLVSDTVTGDITYVAVFKSTPLPVEADKVNWLRVAVVVAIVLFSLGVALVVFFILKKILKNVKNPESAELDTDLTDTEDVQGSAEITEIAEPDTDATEAENVTEEAQTVENDTVDTDAEATEDTEHREADTDATEAENVTEEAQTVENDTVDTDTEATEDTEPREADTDTTEAENVTEEVKVAEIDTDTDSEENAQESVENAELDTPIGVNSEESTDKNDTAEE